MKKLIILSLLALTTVATQAQENKRVRVVSPVMMLSSPKPKVDKKTKKTTIEWPSTENNSWHENVGVLDNVPTVDFKTAYPLLNEEDLASSYAPVNWIMTDEGDNTVLHCYFLMKADVVTNLWLGNAETTILDKATGIIYQARSTVPEQCYNKVFGAKAKVGSVLDLQIVFPRLPETAKDLVIYGVPNWLMRGWDVDLSMMIDDKDRMPEYDPVPEFHMAHKVSDAVNYNKDDHQSWAVYNDPHLIKPVKEKTMALWRTPEATYLAFATEQNWIREYYGRGGNTILLDSQGHQYKCRGVVGYPNDNIFWMEGYPGDYFAITLVFDPLPTYIDNFTYIVPEGEPFKAFGANWSGEVIPNLSVEQLRKNQKLFEYRPRVVVK